MNGRGTAIKARRFGPHGRPEGQAFTVNSLAGGTKRYPNVARLPNDSIVVVWTDTSTGDSEVRFKRFDASGAPLDGGDVLANVSRAGRQAALGLVSNDRGDFLVGYDDAHGCESGCGGEISKGRVFDLTGVPYAATELTFPSSNTSFLEGVAVGDGTFRILNLGIGQPTMLLRQVNIQE